MHIYILYCQLQSSAYQPYCAVGQNRVMGGDINAGSRPASWSYTGSGSVVYTTINTNTGKWLAGLLDSYTYLYPSIL